MKSRYENSQRILWNMKSACFFLCLLSVAEEYTKKKIDLLDAAKYCMDKGWIDAEYFVSNDVKVLEWITGKRVVKSVLDKVGILADNVYSIVKYEYDGGNHFRRRYFDVYNDSIAVQRGRIVAYYVYKIG